MLKTGVPKKRVVALFGLSANPPTRAHQTIVRSLVDQEGIDAVVVFPVYQHAFDNKSKLVAYHHRMQMCHLTFDCLGPRVAVLEVEEEIYKLTGTPPKTIDVLEWFSRSNTTTEYILVMGQDAKADLEAHKWHRSEDILRTFQVLTYDRNPEGISSTKARQATTILDLLNQVPHEVVAYMAQHRLYQFSEK